MYRTISQTHNSSAIVTVAILAITAACSGEQGGKTGLVASVIPSAEASVLPVARVETTKVSTDSTVPIEGSYSAAENAYSAKKYVEAKAMFEDLVSRHPENGWNYYMLALSSWKAGDRVSAESAFNMALERDPRHLKSHLNIARMMIEDGRTRDALVHAEKVVQLDSVSLDGYRLLGRLHGELRNTELALLAYNKAISLHPKDASSMNNMAFILLQEGRVDDALAPLALASVIEPRNATILNNLGMALERTGRFSQASNAYRTALGFESGYEKASTSLARIAAMVDDPGLAPVDLKELAEKYAASIKG